MNHLQFEEWIFSEDKILPDQRKALKSHLNSCESCRQLTFSWQDVGATLNAATMVVPNPGFVNRWQHNLAADDHRKKIRRRWLILLMAVVFLVGIVFNPSLSSFSFPTNLSKQILDGFTSLLAFVRAIASVTESFGRILPDLNLPIILAMANLFIVIIIGVWVITYKKITVMQGVSS